MYGITDAALKSPGKLYKLIVIGCIPCHILFRHSVGSEQSPLIMIAAQPDLCDILELPVLIYLLGIDMAMIINYRELFRIFMIQYLCIFVFQKKVLIHEILFHFSFLIAGMDMHR